MKNKDKKIEEPYEPEDTPKPPQVIEPDSKRERENPVENKNRPDNREENKAESKKERQHLLADETDIDDETTI